MTDGMPRKILVADDEEKILKIVTAYLRAAGFLTTAARNGKEAVQVFRDEKPDCVILDVSMPEMDGFETAREIRKISDAPIIFLSARVEETDRIVGLEIGADDYILKPFSPRELVLRVKAVLRRTSEADFGRGAERILRNGGVVLDPFKHHLKVEDNVVDLTSVQFSILKTLMEEPGRVFSRLLLLDRAIGSSFEGYERTVDAHVKNIRKAMKDQGRVPRYIETVRGVGYRFIDRDDET
jgi:DNA-binding response OmpR family regulator